MDELQKKKNINTISSIKPIRRNVKNSRERDQFIDTRCESHIEMGEEEERGWDGRIEGAVSKRSRIKYVGLTDDRNRAC